MKMERVDPFRRFNTPFCRGYSKAMLVKYFSSNLANLPSQEKSENPVLMASRQVSTSVSVLPHQRWRTPTNHQFFSSLPAPSFLSLLLRPFEPIPHCRGLHLPLVLLHQRHHQVWSLLVFSCERANEVYCAVHFSKGHRLDGILNIWGQISVRFPFEIRLKTLMRIKWQLSCLVTFLPQPLISFWVSSFSSFSLLLRSWCRLLLPTVLLLQTPPPHCPRFPLKNNEAMISHLPVKQLITCWGYVPGQR